MKFKNIKFAKELKIVVYNFLYNFIQFYKNMPKNIEKSGNNFKQEMKYKIKYFNDLTEIENQLKKIFKTKDLDEFKEKKIIKIKKYTDEQYEEFSIRDLLISFGNNIIRNKFLTKELLDETKEYIKINKLNTQYKKTLGEKVLFNFIPIMKNNPDILIIIDNNGNNIIEINHLQQNYSKYIDIKEISVYILSEILEKFINKNIKEILTANDIWTAIALKNIDKSFLNIITDGRFLTELEEINNSPYKNFNVLLIKLNEKEELDSSEVNRKNFKEIYKIYKSSENIEDFLNKIKGKVTGAEELNTLLTIHYYLKEKYKGKTYFFSKKINKNLDKEINEKIKINKVLFNRFGNIENLDKQLMEIYEEIKENNINILTLMANRRSGKDFSLERLKNINLQNNKQAVFEMK